MYYYFTIFPLFFILNIFLYFLFHNHRSYFFHHINILFIIHLFMFLFYIISLKHLSIFFIFSLHLHIIYNFHQQSMIILFHLYLVIIIIYLYILLQRLAKNRLFINHNILIMSNITNNNDKDIYKIKIHLFGLLFLQMGILFLIILSLRFYLIPSRLVKLLKNLGTYVILMIPLILHS